MLRFTQRLQVQTAKAFRGKIRKAGPCLLWGVLFIPVGVGTEFFKAKHVDFFSPQSQNPCFNTVPHSTQTNQPDAKSVCQKSELKHGIHKYAWALG